MATNISGLFSGASKSDNEYKDEYLAGLMTSPAQRGSQSVLQRLISVQGNRGAQLGADLGGLLGGQTQQQVNDQRVRGVMQGVDLTNPESIRASSNQLADMGFPQQAQALREQANEVEDRVMKRQKFNFDTQPTTPDSTKLAKLLNEQSKYQEGTPGFKAYQGAIDKETAAAEGNKSSLEKNMDLAGITDPAARKAYAKQALTLQVQAASGDPTAIAAVNLMSKQLSFQIEQFKLNQLQSKQEASETAKVQGASAEAYKTNNILGTINTSLSQTGGNTTGVVGATLKQIPGTEAVDLEQNLLTIKANIGFNELTQMRKDSPTGGALGQVSDMENKALQAARGSLEQRQSPGQLRKNLESVRDSYDRWLKVITGEWTEVDAQNYLDSLKSKKSEKPETVKVVPTAEQRTLIEKHLKVK